LPTPFRRAVVLACLAAGTVAALVPAATGAVAQATLESVDPAGGPGDGPSGASARREAAVSADGRFLAFGSEAENLVVGDTNGVRDVFVRDRLLGRTTRVSLRSSGDEMDGGSGSPAISRGGRYVAFVSSTAGGPRESDVFVHDDITGRTIRVSTGVRPRRGGRVSSHSPAISGNGRFVTFAAVERIERGGEAETEPLGVFLHDRRRGATTRLGGRDARDAGPATVSADGRFVAFATRARLAPRDRNRLRDAYVLDRRSGRAVLASVGANGRPANRPVEDPVLSADARVVAFESEATTLARGMRGRAYRVYVRDLRSRRTTLASVRPDGRPLGGDATAPALSGDGRRVAFQLSPRSGPIGDVDGPIGRVMLRDRAGNTTTPVGTTPSGRSGFPALSADGRLLAFISSDPLLPSDDNGVMDVYTCGPLD